MNFQSQGLRLIRVETRRAGAPGGRLSHGPPGLARGHLAPSQVVPDSREQRLAAGHLPVSQQLGEHVMYRQCVEDVTRREESYIDSEGWSGHSAQHSAIMDHLDTPGVGQHPEVILSRLSSPVLATSSRSICPMTPSSLTISGSGVECEILRVPVESRQDSSAASTR